MKDLFAQAGQAIKKAQRIVVIQAENPDGDSLGSALALEEILGDLGKQVSLYCPVDIPKYLRYAKGWDRVLLDLPKQFDLSIIVDTNSATLLERALAPENLAQLKSRPCIVLDHHITPGTLPFETISIVDTNVVATGELIHNLAVELGYGINPQAAEDLVISILADSLGLMSEGTKPASIKTVGHLAELGARLAAIDNRRREFMKKSPEILRYKGQLIERVEYALDGQLAMVHIPWEEIAEYSDQYNPSMLVIDEMRLVEGVRVAVAFKTYPDGKITAKIRVNPDAKVAETVAGFFGGGGHPYAAGFRTYSDDFASVKNELIGAVDKALLAYDKTNEPC